MLVYPSGRYRSAGEATVDRAAIRIMAKLTIAGQRTAEADRSAAQR
jgi:hypothetical protein